MCFLSHFLKKCMFERPNSRNDLKNLHISHWSWHKFLRNFLGITQNDWVVPHPVLWVETWNTDWLDDKLKTEADNLSVHICTPCLKTLNSKHNNMCTQKVGVRELMSQYKS